MTACAVPGSEVSDCSGRAFGLGISALVQEGIQRSLAGRAGDDACPWARSPKLSAMIAA